MKRFLVIASLFVAAHSWAAFGYYSPISINSAQVPSTLTDFPILVSVTDARFKTVGNGGHVQNSSGFDIRPYTNSGLGTAITGYELERYNASTGEVVMWVKISSLSSSTTPLVLAYGDAGISTNGSSTTTWSNKFGIVYHLKDGTTLSLFESLAGTATGTNHSATATTGQIDGAAGFVAASSQYIDIGTPALSSWFTVSAWVKATSFPNALNAVFVNDNNVDTLYAKIFVKSNGKLNMSMTVSTVGSISYDGTGTTTLSTGTWYYITMRYISAPSGSGGGMYGYVNGSQDNYVAANSASHGSTGVITNLGKDPTFGGKFWDGSIDHVTTAFDSSGGGARSTDWITTEYNNQSAPGTFETLGTEVCLTCPTGTSNFFQFFPQ
jgi:hypothetical protein